MARPLKINSGNLQQMTDSEMEGLVYKLQLAYVTQINADGMGSIKVQSAGGSYESIGSMLDTRSKQQQNTRNAPSDDGVTQTYPSYPGITSEDVTTFNYSQKKASSGMPAFPTNFTNSFLKTLIVDGSYQLQLANTAADFFDDILNLTINEIANGNEVGSYRVSTSNPSGSGGAGTWADKGTWFLDRRYNNVGNTNYKLWLKTDLTTPPTMIAPIGFDTGTGNPKEMSFNSNDPLMTDVLLPALTRRILDTNLTYVVNTSASNGAGFIQRGSFSNTRYNQSSNTQHTSGTGMSEVYISRSTPNTGGTTTTVSTEYLHLKI